MTENANKWSRENPWMGLGTYSEGQRLFGRDKETAALTDIILNHTAIVVYGKSGIGKSSLLKAGVFPLLRQQLFVPIYLRLAHNTDIPYTQQIENAISENIILQDLLPNDIPDLGLWDFMHRKRFCDTQGNAVTPVIVLDQFEEIFTLTQVQHKADIQAFFTELADVLNNVKPDKVIQAELSYAQSVSKPSKGSVSKGFTLQPLSKSVLKYEKSPSFRFVISLRDDSLYLLERNSAKIPALKANRYNLNALDEENTMEVIMKPFPGLFSETEGKEILDGLAYYEYEDYRVVDPAMLSLFLFSYYKEQGKVSYTDIFEHYYQDCTKDLSESSIIYIEDHLLTDRGNRNQIPLNDLIAMGISASEMDLLLQRKILKTEKRKGVDYVEYSHDRLCEQALKHREERKMKEQTKKLRKKMLFFSFIGLLILGIMSIFVWQHRQMNISNEQRLITLIENDSINRLNKSLRVSDSLNKELNKSLSNKKDSISRLYDSLNIQVQVIEHQKESLKNQLSKNIRLGDEKQKLLTRYEKRNEELEQTLKDLELAQKNIKAQEKVLGERFDDELFQEANYDISINAIYNLCLNIYDAIESGDYHMLDDANKKLKKMNTSYFSSLRSITENPSLDGHFIFNGEYIDSLIAGNTHYNAQLFEYRSALRNSNTSTLFTRNSCVEANNTAKFQFRSRGHQELAVVTEPGGLVTLRVHDTTNDVWYNDTKNVKKGQPSRILIFDLPTNKHCVLELEVINKSNKDISFVVISN